MVTTRRRDGRRVLMMASLEGNAAADMVRLEVASRTDLSPALRAAPPL
jgi:hypothetical protein